MPTTKIKIIRGDITTVAADAIVNAANAQLVPGGGVDGAIHRAAGSQLFEECFYLYGKCPTGEAVITHGFKLPAHWVIHTVGPIWGTDKNPEKLLADCYLNSLKRAQERETSIIKTIAFPAISTGAYGFPKELAAKIVHATVMNFIDKNDHFDEIIFVLHSNEDFEIYKKTFGEDGKK